jgi:nucleotide-binding universal stress UspA family protein
VVARPPARQTTALPRARQFLGYRRILVPLIDNLESRKALDNSCRLATNRGASITALAVIEIPQQLPLDAQMTEEEEDARQLLDRAQATVNSHGISLSTRLLRAREAATAIIDQADALDIDLLVIGAPRKPQTSKRAIFGNTVQHVLRGARCRVLVIAAPQRMTRP